MRTVFRLRDRHAVPVIAALMVAAAVSAGTPVRVDHVFVATAIRFGVAALAYLPARQGWHSWRDRRLRRLPSLPGGQRRG